jgi:ribosomal-protein-alanine N-acetyltransferase
MGRAVSALLAHAFDGLGLLRVFACVRRDNTPSQRLLARQGFPREGVLRGHRRCQGVPWDFEVHGLRAGERARPGA